MSFRKYIGFESIEIDRVTLNYSDNKHGFSIVHN